MSETSEDYQVGYAAGYEVGLAAGQAAAEAGSAVEDLAVADAVALDSVIQKVTELSQRMDVVEAEVGIKFTG